MPSKMKVRGDGLVCIGREKGEENVPWLIRRKDDDEEQRGLGGERGCRWIERKGWKDILEMSEKERSRLASQCSECSECSELQ